ncbi:pyrroloquinoline quinone biosynthesis peptide chaperone PqqD [Asaia bogorensis]|uniref:pyrroloquinoline quinone biosynthesis peptide chaperone PqqD n=1 Tax=Asaia bogorensis TaxID=91915 RepID=UPI0028637022|nr:pyrroloquinoline quinone biosynthesis peptide chaperone PqqD [Asaia bogorensis]MDR6183480.1 pyrroloquinoline quinone biosynthesis protein D [Asaia bogorensis NBRC 16594]
MSVSEDSILKFTRGHRLQHDRVRDVWLVQAPEKAFIADPIAAAILRLVDGARPLSAIIDDLAATYHAPRETIATDVQVLLASLMEQKVLVEQSPQNGQTPAS